MSQIVTGNTDALAAEYVLGTLDPDERTQAHALLESDQEFAAKVRLWERRLGELHLMVEPVEPDGKIWERIKAKMPQLEPAPELPPVLPEAPVPDTASAESAVPPSLNGAAPAAPDGGLPPTPMLVPSPSPAPTPPPVATTVVAAPSPTVAPPPLPPPPAAKPAVAPALTPRIETAAEPKSEARSKPGRDQAAIIRGRLSRWRVFGVLMLMLVLAVAALLAAWRFVPDRVPPMLRAAEVMRLIGVPMSGSAPPRRPAPPESQFDE